VRVPRGLYAILRPLTPRPTSSAGVVLLLGVLLGLWWHQGPGAALAAASASVETPAPETVLEPSSYEGMFQLYEENRARGIGNYVTVDFVLTAYGLLQRDLLSSVEAEVLYPACRELLQGLVTALVRPGPAAPGHTMALAYVGVVARLLDPEVALPQEVLPQVQAELVLIAAHQGVALSAITGVREDFSQYVPRGRYTASESLQRYFRALMYAGRVGLLVRASQATGVTTALADEHTAAALRISQAIMHNAHLQQRYARVQQVLEFVVGPAEDLTPADYVQAADNLPLPQARQELLDTLSRTGRWPRLLSTVVDKARLEPHVTVPEVVAGFRLLPQRYTPDAEALQRLTYDHVTTYRGTGTPFTLSVINGRPVRGLPSVLDVMVALGSQTAFQVLTERGDTAYDGYAEQLAAVSALLRQSPTAPASLSGLHLQLMRAMLAAPEAPARLNAALGWWMTTRHLLLLYTKQSYTVAEKSLRLTPARPVAALEPAVPVYDALLAALAQTATVLGQHVASTPLAPFTEVVQRLRALASKAQPEGGWLRAPEDIAYVNDLDQRLKALLTGTDVPLVVDVHTEPNSQRVLEAGLGAPLLVTIGAESAVRGARFHCYEFTQPMSQRLTDALWQDIVRTGQAHGALSTRLLAPASR